MTGESFAILAVIVVMQAMLLRAGKREVALLAFPLLGVPLFYLAATALGTIFGTLGADVLYPGMVVAGALVGIGGCLALARYIRHRVVKTGYLTLGCGFLAAVAVSFLMRLL